jgi:threonine 3-dehydrogenase
MRDSMWALTYDRTTDPWDKSSGMRRTEVERPTLDEAKNFTDSGMVLIRTRFAGFCGSDRGIWFRRSFGDMIYEGLDRDHKDKRVMGHELLGEVVAVGSLASREFGYQPGDIVSTESHIVCGTCYQCRTGDNHVCADNLIIGISTDGCFAEYVKLPARALWRTDTRRIRPEIAALQEPFGNAVHACTKVNLRGKRVAIIGCGTIGLFAVAVAKASARASSSASSRCRRTPRRRSSSAPTTCSRRRTSKLRATPTTPSSRARCATSPTASASTSRSR